MMAAEDIDIRVVPRRKVPKGSLAYSDYDSKTITLPEVNSPDKKLTDYEKELYELVGEAYQRYLLQHELGEIACRPGKNKKAHVNLEVNALDYLEREDPLAYAVGLALHKMRIEGGDETGFSTMVNKRCNVDRKTEGYKGLVESVTPYLELIVEE